MDRTEIKLQPYFEKVATVAPTIREYADRAEREAQMPAEVAEAFHQAGLFRILLPGNMGGGELTIPESLRVVEEVSRIDGSAGWNLAICSAGPLFGHFLARGAFDTIFGDPRAISVGSLNPMTSEAAKVDGGWQFSGRVNYTSGSAHATYLMATALVLHDGAPRIVDGIPHLRAGMFPIQNAKILNTWSTAGMRGTGSNDCVFENVFVPDEFTFDWLNATPTWQHGPFESISLPLQMAGVLAAVVIGIARHARDAVNEIAQSKVPTATRALLRERSIAQTQFAQAEGLLQAARAYFYQNNDEIWRKGEAGESFSRMDHAHARLASVTAVKLALQAIDLVTDIAGMNAVKTSSPIEKCWRDAHTASQHVLLSTARFEIVGRVLFGLDPGSPVI